jgi:hypothetical protein
VPLSLSQNQSQHDHTAQHSRVLPTPSLLYARILTQAFDSFRYGHAVDAACLTRDFELLAVRDNGDKGGGGGGGGGAIL